MRALVVTDFGATPELLDIQRPEPAPGEVRVRVRAASVNGSDKAVAAGYLKKRHDGAPLPGGAGQGLRRRDRCRRRRGRRFCGRGSGVRGGHQGPPERRFLRRVRHRPHLGRAGEAARSIEFAEAASLGLAGAAVASIDAAELTAGHTVLVVGATGGVGGQVVQLAARAGAQVIATADAASEAHVRDLGAAEVIDYTGDVPAATLAAHPGGVDVLVHLAGDPTALLPVVRPGGKFISTLIGSPDRLPSDTVTVLPIFANPTADILNRLAGNQDSGDTKVTVEQTYPLDDAARALTDFGAGSVGKRVIVIA